MCEAEQRIRAAEAKISKNAFETAIVFDDDGNVVLEKVGGETEVGFTDEELPLVKGRILTHNHTYFEHSESVGIESISSFSSDDLMIAYQQGLQQVRLVVGNELHTFRWNNPQKRQAERFLYEVEELESELNIPIIAAEEKIEEALARYESDQSDENYEEMIKKSTVYYREQKLQADKMNAFIKNNQHVGYVYRKERLL